MIRVSVLYPAGPAFDMDDYLNRHTPMVRVTLGAAIMADIPDYTAAQPVTVAGEVEV